MGVPRTTLYEYCTQHPEAQHLLEEYDAKLNQKSVYEIGANTGSTKAWWYCKKHKFLWAAFPNYRIKHLQMPCCSGKVPTKERNLAVLFPEILEDFKPELNIGIDPSKLLPYSHVRITWKCHKCGHIWDTECGDRVSKLTGCPNCSSNQTSKAEKLLISYFKSIFPNTKKMKIDKTEFDVVIPEIRVAIEYDGYPWHLKKKEQHIKKLNIANNNEITLINIAEYKNSRDIVKAVQDQYAPEHNVLFYEINSTYDISNLLNVVVEYFRNNGVNLPDPDIKLIKHELSRVQMSEKVDSVWNSKTIPWIRNWIAEEDISLAKCVSEGSDDKIAITCPNCGRRWETPAHWIKKQFRGCTKRSGGCGFQGLMGDQMEKSSENFRKSNESRRAYLHNYYQEKSKDNHSTNSN